MKLTFFFTLLASVFLVPVCSASGLPFDEWRQGIIKRDLTWLDEVNEEMVQALTDYRSGEWFLIVAFAGDLGCQVPVVNKLLQSGLDANTELPRFGDSLASLVIAVKGETDLACMQSLVDHGLDVKRDFPQQRISLLNAAILNKQTEIIDLLCEKGTDPYLVDNTQRTAFDFLEIVKLPKSTLDACLSE